MMIEGEMINQADSEAKQCKFCDVSLDTVSSLQNSVCTKCYRAFVFAGLSDEEIFKPVIPKPSE
jgi:protein-arginine kinase activator protein McsA